MAVRFVLVLLHAWHHVCAVGILVLVTAVPALAGTNTWTSNDMGATAPACASDSPSFAAVLACVENFPLVPPAVLCPPAEIASVTGYLSTFIRFDSSEPYNCSPTPGTALGQAWFFTNSCSSIGKEYNGTFGGCVEICTAPETLSLETGQCGVPASQQRCGANGSISKGNPCEILSGNKMQREIDYAPGTGVLAFARTYNSLRSHPAKDGPHGKPLGESWFASYFQFISAPSGLNSSVVHAVRPNGDVIEFTATSPGSTSTEYEAEGELKERLVVALTSGTFVGWRYITASDNVEFYDTNGRLLSIKERGGATQTLSYGSSSLVESVVDDFGHELEFQWDSESPPRLTSIVLPGSTGEIELAYGSDSNLVSVTYPDATERHYLYELTSSSQRNLLTGIEDESDVRYATWTYGAGNRVTSSVHAGGAESYSFSYNTGGSRTVVDPFGTSVTYTSDVIAGQARYTGSSSQCESCGREYESATFDSYGNFESTTDFNGVETRYTHDVARTLETSRTEAYGTANERTITTDWHATFRLPEEITEPGRVTSFTYDTNGNVLTQTITDAATSQSRTWTMTYTTLDQLLTIDGPRTDVTDVTTFTYYTCTTGSQCGQLHTVTDAANNVTTYGSYNAHGLPLSLTDPNGTSIALAYDSRQRLTSRTIAGEATTFDYWPTGLLKKVTQPDGSFISYGYDAAHRLTSVTDTAGNTITYTLNGAGQRLTEEVRDAASVLAFRKTRIYDDFGRLIEEHGTAGQVTSFEYDDEGNLTEIEDPVGRITGQVYDELNRLASLTDPALGLTEFGYDDLDNLLSVTDPRALVTSYVYNGFGEPVSQTSPDTGTSTSPRDAAGNVATATDARSEAGVYTYDALNRVTEIEYGDDTVTFGYDSGTNGNGRLTSAANGASSTSWTYDAVGRVTERSQTTGSVTLDVGYGYDSYGRLASLTTPSSQVLSYEYEDGRVSAVKVNGSYLLSDVSYAPFSPTTGWTWGNSTTTSRTYDTDGQLAEISSAGSSSYTFNDDGTIETRSDDFAPDLSWSAGSTTFTVASTSNRLQSATGQVSRSYAYDAGGNTTSDGSRTFTYTDAGRMKTSTAGTLTTTYSYNGLGERAKKTNSVETTYFAYDEAGHLIGEYDASGDLIQETVWFGDIPVATLKPNGGSGIDVFYVHTDHLNTPRRITRPSDNAIIWRWDSDPFGTTAANDDPDNDTVEFAYNLRFPGQYLDDETGLHYNYYRDYDPATGRYVQSDPIGVAGGLNTYLYVSANPLSRSDPLGLQERAAPGYTFPSYGSPWPVGSEINTRIHDALIDVVDRIVDWCTDEDDGCQRLYAEIEQRMSEVKRRYWEYIADTSVLPETGPNSREGHRRAYYAAQRGLRNKLEEAQTKGCLAFNPSAWDWATRPLVEIPNPDRLPGPGSRPLL